MDLRYHAIILISSVDVCAYAAVMDEAREPVMCFFCKRLRFPTPVCQFRRVDPSDSYVKLCFWSVADLMAVQVSRRLCQSGLVAEQY